ncbi:MAG: PqqD family protein [Acidimicrobiia bacterium]
MSPESYRVNAPTVAAETVDGEVLMIHLDSGNYYSLRDTGAIVWGALEQGVATEAIVDALGGDAARAEIERFLAELVAENLVVATDAPVTDTWVGTLPASACGAPAAPPVLEKFTDMQHLILLDPVHEVDAGEGWPVQRSDA